MDEISGKVLLIPGLQLLIDLLRERGWRVVGPTVRGSAVTRRCSGMPSARRGGSRCCSPPASCCGAGSGPAPRWTSGQLRPTLPSCPCSAYGDEILHAARADCDAAREVGAQAAGRMGRSSRPSGGACGTPASPPTSPTCTAAASACRCRRATDSGPPALLAGSLDERLRRRAGRSWLALAEATGRGALPHHSFHVLDRCRIR